MNNEQLRQLWRNAGGSFHGPNVETGTMPEVKLLPLLRQLAASREVYAALERVQHAGLPLETSNWIGEVLAKARGES